MFGIIISHYEDPYEPIRTSWNVSAFVTCYPGESIISNPLLRKLAELRPTTLRVAQERVSGLPEMLHKDLAELLDALIQDTKRGLPFCVLFPTVFETLFFVAS